MEALAALSLACNIIQLVDFTVESIQGCKELYNNDVRSDDGAIELYAKNITDANTALQDALKQQQQQQQQQQPHPRGYPTRLTRIANVASTTAGEIMLEINTLRVPQSQGIRRAGVAFRIALKRFATSAKINKLLKQLRRNEEVLNSSLIKELYVQLNCDNDLRNAELAKLAQSQQAIVDRILASQPTITGEIAIVLRASEDRLALRMSAQDTAAAIQQKTQSTLLHEQLLESRKRHVLGALSFPEQKERQNMVESRLGDFGGTYNWIFSRLASGAAATSAGDTQAGPGAAFGWDLCGLSDDTCDTGYTYRFSTSRENVFMEWLEQANSSLYWITGKAGSGKSSLMNYIYLNLHSEIAESQQLRIWTGSREIRLVSFWFFRPASSFLLRTMQGFWRSLCFQVLDADDSLHDQICSDPDNSAPASLKSCLASNGSSEVAWTDKELESWLHYLVSHSKFYYLLLVDGLDEVEERHDHLVDVVISLSKQHKNVKVCCSSRPEPLLSHRLNHYATLHLDKVNSADILHCCKSILQGTKAECFVTRISTRACGVFLWGHLVAKDLARASAQQARMDELEAILDDCPDEIGELFLHMLQRMERYARRRPKPYLLLIQHAASNDTALSLFELYFATIPASESPKWCLLNGKFDPEYLRLLNSGLRGFWSRVETACAGLVELANHDGILDPATTRILRETAPIEDYSEILQACRKQVLFIHTSVSEFLQVHDVAKAHVADADISADQIAVQFAGAVAANAFLTNEELSSAIYVRRLARKVVNPLHGIADARRSPATQEILDAFFDQLARRTPSNSITACFITAGGEFSPDIPFNCNLKFAWISSLGYWDLVKLCLDKEPHERKAILSGYLLWRYCCYGFWADSSDSPHPLTFSCAENLAHCALSYRDFWRSIHLPTTTALVSRTSLCHHLITIAARLRIEDDSETLNPRSSPLPILERSLDNIDDTLADIWAVWDHGTGGLMLLPGFDHDCSNSQSECLSAHFVIHLRFRAKDILTNAPLPVLLMGWKLKEHTTFIKFGSPHYELDTDWQAIVEETLRKDVTTALELFSQKGLQRSAEDFVPNPVAESTGSSNVVKTFMTSFWTALERVKLVGAPEWPFRDQPRVLTASWLGYSDEYDPTIYEEGPLSAMLSDATEHALCGLEDVDVSREGAARQVS